MGNFSGNAQRILRKTKEERNDLVGVKARSVFELMYDKKKQIKDGCWM